MSQKTRLDSDFDSTHSTQLTTLVVPHGVWRAAVVGEADGGVDGPAQLAVLGHALALARQLAYLLSVARTVLE